MRLNVELKNELYAEVSVHAEREGRSISDVVRVLLLDWCKAKRREEREERARACAQEKVAGGNG
jgi:negative regulator of replication initiation